MRIRVSLWARAEAGPANPPRRNRGMGGRGLKIGRAEPAPAITRDGRAGLDFLGGPAED